MPCSLLKCCVKEQVSIVPRSDEGWVCLHQASGTPRSSSAIFGIYWENNDWSGTARSCRHILRTYDKEWCLQVCSVLLSQRSYTLGPPEKMKAIKSGLQVLPVFSPFLPRPLKSQVLSATCFYSHQPFPHAQRRGDKKQIADLEDTFMAVRKMGQGLFLQPCEQVVWLRSHLCIFYSLQQKTMWQLLPYCLLWTVPSASCNLNCVWRLPWKVPLGVLTIKHSHNKSPFSCLLIEISPNS